MLVKTYNKEIHIHCKPKIIENTYQITKKLNIEMLIKL